MGRRSAVRSKPRKPVEPPKKDIFDRISLDDIFDRVDLPVEEKVIYSKEMDQVLRQEIARRIAELPIGPMINNAIQVEMSRHIALLSDSVRNRVVKSETKVTNDLTSTKEDLRSEMKTFLHKLNEKYDELKTNFLNAGGPQYTFGGYSPQVNDLNIGDPTIEGAWRIVKSDVNLSIQRYESGAWTEKGAFTP